MALEYKIEEDSQGKVSTIFFSGRFKFRDHDTFFEIVDMIKYRTRAIDSKVVFDFSELEFLDSAALGMLVIVHDEAAAKDVYLVIKGAKGKVKDVLYAARFDTLYGFVD